MQKGVLAGVVAGIAVGMVTGGLGVGAIVRGPDGGVEEASALAAGEAAPFVAVAPVAFEDPAGDATDLGSGDTSTRVGCFIGYMLSNHCQPVPPTPGIGTPGPHYDITGVAVTAETAEEIQFTLTVASISEGFAELATPDALHRMSFYDICWMSDDDDYCSRNMYLDVMVHDGEPMLHAAFDTYVQDCNEWWWCTWTIPVDIVYGTPATITFHVPKAYPSIDGRPLNVDRLEASTAYSEDASVFPMWHPGLTVHTPIHHTHTHSGVPGVFQLADQTAEYDVDVTFSPPPSTDLWTAPGPVLPAAASTHATGTSYDRKELDVTGVDLYEDGTDLVVLIAVADLTEVPTYGFDIEGALGIRAAEVWEFGVRGEGGELSTYLGECVMAECQDGVMIEVPLEVTTGAPGFFALRLPLTTLKEPAGPEPGLAVTMVSVSSMYTEGSQYWGSFDEPLWGDVHHAFMVDSVYGGTSYIFGSGHRAPLESFAVEAHEHEH